MTFKSVQLTRDLQRLFIRMMRIYLLKGFYFLNHFKETCRILEFFMFLNIKHNAVMLVSVKICTILFEIQIKNIRVIAVISTLVLV